MSKLPKSKNVRTAKRNIDRFSSAVRRSALLSERRANSFVYQISELIECCESFSTKVNALRGALLKANQDSTELWHASCNLSGEFEHFKYHIRRASTITHALADQARAMPPMNKMSDDELSNMVLREAYAGLDEAKKKAAAWGQREKPAKAKSPKGKSGTTRKTAKKTRSPKKKKAAPKRKRKSAR